MIGRDLPDFYGEMVFSKNSEYNKPFCIVIYGLPYSGKTYLSKELSKGLNLYLLNGDYVRYIFYAALRDEVPDVMNYTRRIVDQIDLERIYILCSNGVSFIFDGNQKDIGVYNSLLEPLTMAGYDTIRIAINSNKDNCLNNLSKRRIGFSGFDDSVMGDCLFYNPPLSQNMNGLEVPNPDYVIDNLGTLEDFDNNIKELITKIRKARGRKNER